jgi:hypothetical protein
MPWSCYNYPADGPAAPPDHDARRDLRRMPLPCYSYPSMCSGYPDDMPPGGNPGVVGSAPPGLRQLPTSTCFRY